MKMTSSLLVALLLTVQCSVATSCGDKDAPSSPTLPLTQVSFIPQPTALSYGTANVVLPTPLTVSDRLSGMPAQLLNETLGTLPGGGTATAAANDKAFIRLTSDSSLPEEGYTLTVGEEGIDVGYSTDKGLLWGIQTLRQLLLQHTASADGRLSVPMLTINDAPRYAWRGFHVDVARHMFTLDFLKKIADCLSFYKVNKLQIHLTDDQGWRIQIKKYPELTTIGGWRTFDRYDQECIDRSKTDPDYTIDQRFIRNGNEYGGYYTQDELKSFIDYATARGMEVIPEVDMPGHFTAAMKAFPNLSCTDGTGWGKEFSFPVCAGRTENYPFFYDILDEVSALFPATHFHIGADEVEKDNWIACPRCQQLIAEQRLMGVDELQNYFVKQMVAHLKGKGKQVMAWDDAFFPPDPQDLLYTYWRDWLSNQPATITQQGHPIIFMEWGRFYLSGNSNDATLRSLYQFNFEPQFPGIVQSQVKGFQACMWTETIPNETKFGQFAFPSLQAFSEVAWGSPREWNNFLRRLPWHLSWLTQNGLHYRKPAGI
jgi:hexosaminidase